MFQETTNNLTLRANLPRCTLEAFDLSLQSTVETHSNHAALSNTHLDSKHVLAGVLANLLEELAN